MKNLLVIFFSFMFINGFAAVSEGAWRGGYMNSNLGAQFTLQYSNRVISYYDNSSLHLVCNGTNSDITYSGDSLFLKLKCNKKISTFSSTLKLEIKDYQKLANANETVILDMESNAIGSEQIYVKAVPNIKFSNLQSYNSNLKLIVGSGEGSPFFIRFLGNGLAVIEQGKFQQNGKSFEFGQWKVLKKGEQFDDLSVVQESGEYWTGNRAKFVLRNNVLTVGTIDNGGNKVIIDLDLRSIANNNIYLTTYQPSGTEDVQIPVWLNGESIGYQFLSGDAGFPAKPE